MLQTIVIGIDGRPQDAEALALARRLGDPGAELIATSVAIDGLVRRASKLDEEGAERVVDAFTEPRAQTEGVVTHATSVGKGLARAAVGARADLIVVASSRRGLLGRTFAGDSVADVLRHAPCPVAIAPVGYDATGPITDLIVGYDRSREADLALHSAMQLAARDGGRVRVIEVVEPFTSVVAANDLGGPTTAGYEELQLAYDQAQTDLAHLTEQYDLEGEVTTGRAAHELAQAAAAADVLCIGLHAHGLLDRLAMGSTAHALLREQPAPLLITTPGVGAEQRQTTDALDSIDSASAD